MTDKILLTYADVVSRVETASGRLDYVNAVPMTPEHPGWDPDLYEEGEDNGLATCAYLTKEGQPSCIVGQAFYTDLTDLGLTPNANLNEMSVGALIRDLLSHRFAVTQKALRFLEVVQNHQDQGEPWGIAIEAAKRAADDGRNPEVGYDDTEPYDVFGFPYA